MADYVLTKDVNRQTGELPDKVTIIVPQRAAWWIVKQLELQLEQGKEIVSVDLLGKLEEKQS